MLLGIGFDRGLGLPRRELTELASEAEALGFDSVWTPAGGVPDALHLCASWAQSTSLVVGVGVVPAPRMWHPLSLASQAATVAGIAQGNFVLGLGTGGAGARYWQELGLPNRPIRIMRTYVSVVRTLLAGAAVDTDWLTGELRCAPLEGLTPTVVPIYLAALGPAMLRLAGEIADGVMLNWATTDRVEIGRRIICDAARSAGRPDTAVPVAMYIRMCIDDDVRAARRALAKQVLAYALGEPGVPGAGYHELFTAMGFDRVLHRLSAARDQGTLDDELVDLVPEDLLRSVGYFGPATAARDSLARLARGLDHPIVRLITVAPDIERVRAAIRAVAPSQ